MAELQEAHPGAHISWYQGLQPLVDSLARDQGFVDLAHKLVEDRLSQASGRTWQCQTITKLASESLCTTVTSLHFCGTKPNLNTFASIPIDGGTGIQETQITLDEGVAHLGDRL